MKLSRPSQNELFQGGNEVQFPGGSEMGYRDGSAVVFQDGNEVEFQAGCSCIVTLLFTGSVQFSKIFSLSQDLASNGSTIVILGLITPLCCVY